MIRDEKSYPKTNRVMIKCGVVGRSIDVLRKAKTKSTITLVADKRAEL